MPNHALTSENVRAASGRADQNPGQVMIFYCWTALAAMGQGSTAQGSTAQGQAAQGPTARGGSEPVAMGITDDRGRAMRAGEEALKSGEAATVIVEAVRPAMAPATLAPCYLGTGVGWLGRRGQAGDVHWHRFFLAPGPGIPAVPRPRAVTACPALAVTARWQDWTHETADLH
jgi:hypothetical protein